MARVDGLRQGRSEGRQVRQCHHVGFEFGTDNTKPQQLVTYYWQAGGEFMTKDGKTATIDNDIMRQTLKWMYDAI